ncbi:MAG TPA: response regulator [Holophagaceae bacterium]|nr:response regulator [Holophagaceae bacterium]
MVIGKLFGKDKDDRGDSDLALAYLEDAQAKRIPLTLVDPKGRELPAHVQAVLEDRVSFSASGLMPVEKGDKFSILLVIDGLRLRIKLRAYEIKNGVLQVAPPTEIELAERRKKPRARISSKEGATGTALTGLFDGIGATGTVENVSEGGFRLKVEKAMEIKGERKLHPSQNLMMPGTPLMMVKLSKLPKASNIETDGKVAYAQMDGATLYLGITFSSDQSALRGLISSRSGAIPTTVPPKARRAAEKPRDHEAPRPESRHEAPAPPPAAAAPPQHPAPISEPAPSAPPAAPAPPAPAPANGEAKADRSAALSNLKRRTRAILVAMEDHPDRDWLNAFLQDLGYQRIYLASTLTEILEALDQPGISLILIDGGVAELKGMELADFLKQRLGEGKPPVMLAAETVQTVMVLAAKRAGVDQILVKPYDHDENLSTMIDGLVGL